MTGVLVYAAQWPFATSLAVQVNGTRGARVRVGREQKDPRDAPLRRDHRGRRGAERGGDPAEASTPGSSSWSSNDRAREIRSSCSRSRSKTRTPIPTQSEDRENLFRFSCSRPSAAVARPDFLDGAAASGVVVAREQRMEAGGDVGIARCVGKAATGSPVVRSIEATSIESTPSFSIVAPPLLAVMLTVGDSTCALHRGATSRRVERVFVGSGRDQRVDGAERAGDGDLGHAGRDAERSAEEHLIADEHRAHRLERVELRAAGEVPEPRREAYRRGDGHRAGDVELDEELLPLGELGHVARAEARLEDARARRGRENCRARRLRRTSALP